MKYKRLENILLAVISLFVGLRMVFYYTSTVPDFDIGFNEGWIFLVCNAWTFALWGIMLFVFRFIRKEVDDTRKRRLFKIAAVLVYWLIVWCICYYQCAIKAVQDWNDMVNGNMG